MDAVTFANKLFSVGVVIGHLVILFSIGYFLFFRQTKNRLVEFFQKHGMLLAFLVALISMTGSLFYSEYAGFNPCELCWFQRIFMYPQVFLLGLALWKKERQIIDYALLLAIVGGLISIYHNYIYYLNKGLNSYCTVGGKSVSCITRYMFEFGYVTIPLMALTGFLLIITFLLFYKKGAGSMQ